jgi:hypothetical protein
MYKLPIYGTKIGDMVNLDHFWMFINKNENVRAFDKRDVP